MLTDLQAMETVLTEGYVVLIEKTGGPSYNEIESELEFLKRMRVAVLGGILVG